MKGWVIKPHKQPQALPRQHNTEDFPIFDPDFNTSIICRDTSNIFTFRCIYKNCAEVTNSSFEQTRRIHTDKGTSSSLKNQLTLKALGALEGGDHRCVSLLMS